DPDLAHLSSTEYVAPRNEIEVQLTEIWQELLGVDKIGIYDNFFELGGHSLLIVRLISGLQSIGYTVQVRDVFSNPSIALLSAKLSLVSSVSSIPANGITVDCNYITPEMVPLISLSQEELEILMDTISGGALNIEDIYPLAPLQEGIYFHHLMSNPTQGDPYVTPSLLSFPSAAKRSQFIEGLEFVINRHDVLRTCVLSRGFTQNIQLVLREVVLAVEDLLLDISKEILPQLEQAISPENLWMDVSKAPLLRLQKADDIEKEEYYLIVNYHHLVLDHVGLEKIIEEISMYVSGQGDQLLSPDLYRNFIGDIICNYSLAASEDYFGSLLGEIDEPTYPFGLSNTLGDGSTKIDSSKVMLSSELSSSIRSISSKLQMSPAVLFHAAFGLVVSRCSNSEYALFGSLFSGRLQGSEGSASSLGLFINTLPVLLYIEDSVVDYLTQTKERLRDMLPYEQTPLSSVHQWSGMSNDVHMFSALLNYRHSAVDDPFGVTSENTTDFDLGLEVLAGEERTNYPFTLDVDDYGDDFRLIAKIADVEIDAIRVVAYMEETL
ncbi:condensation domain-containing protein, partial [Aquimarina sp. RZ0]|uniref:condensation domain-containing protein n=1 Tax=Aquimarina sp. RZ0 TaxID=2607730 RepID=UPI001254C1EA